MMRMIFFLMIPFVLFSCGDKEPSRSPEEQLKYDIGLIENYLKDKNLVAEKTGSGMHYIITQEGDNEGNPAPGSNVIVRYKGYFTNGEVFDQTTGGETIAFGLNQVIKGWQEAVPLLSRGGKGTFLLPSALGYGSRPPRGIPANAVLIFDIELVDF